MNSRGIRVDTQWKPYGVAREALADVSTYWDNWWI